MAGELGAADGWQTLHGHRGRVQGGRGRAQVRAAPLGMAGKCWDSAWSSFPFTLCPGRLLAGETEVNLG